jgi:hypothetical protein
MKELGKAEVKLEKVFLHHNYQSEILTNVKDLYLLADLIHHWQSIKKKSILK